MENGHPIACYNVALPGILDLASDFTTLPDTVKALDNVPFIFFYYYFSPAENSGIVSPLSAQNYHIKMTNFAHSDTSGCQLDLLPENV